MDSCDIISARIDIEFYKKGSIGGKHKKNGLAFANPFGTSMGTRTPVFAVRGRRLDRLTMEAYWQRN